MIGAIRGRIGFEWDFEWRHWNKLDEKIYPPSSYWHRHRWIWMGFVNHGHYTRKTLEKMTG